MNFNVKAYIERRIYDKSDNKIGYFIQNWINE